jgi:hypothetical protein
VDLPPGFEGYHPRAVLLAAALLPPLRRARRAGAGVAAGAAVLIAVLLPHGLPIVLQVLIPVVPATAAAATAALIVLPLRTLRAFATFSWLARRELPRVRGRTGAAMPTSSLVTRSWLAATPPTPANAGLRVELLVNIGELDAAKRELADLRAPETDRDRLDEAVLRQLVAFVATGQAELDRLAAVVRSFAPDHELVLEASVALALADARSRLAAGDADWQAPLIEAGRELGSSRWVAVARSPGLAFFAMFAIVALAASAVTALAVLRMVGG